MDKLSPLSEIEKAELLSICSGALNKQGVELLRRVLIELDILKSKHADSSFKFFYKNHRGEINERTVIPKRFWFGTTDWYPMPQMFLSAFDLDRNENRDFAVSNIIDEDF